MDGLGTDKERREIRRVLNNISEREMREIIKQAIKELFHEQVQQFGWWSIRTLSVFVFGGLILLAVYLGGIQK